MVQPLNNILQTLITSEHRWKLVLFKHWNEIIGDMHDKVVIQEIKDSVLILSVSHPTWAHELFLLIPLLKQKINSYLANDYIKAIRLRVKTFQPQSMPRRQIIKSVYKPHVYIQPSPQEQALLGTIVNHELRDALSSFLLRCKNQKREK